MECGHTISSITDSGDGFSAHCTLDSGHAGDHRCDYRVADPDRGSPWTVPASTTWPADTPDNADVIPTPEP